MRTNLYPILETTKSPESSFRLVIALALSFSPLSCESDTYKTKKSGAGKKLMIKRQEDPRRNGHKALPPEEPIREERTPEMLKGTQVFKSPIRPNHYSIGERSRIKIDSYSYLIFCNDDPAKDSIYYIFLATRSRQPDSLIAETHILEDQEGVGNGINGWLIGEKIWLPDISPVPEYYEGYVWLKIPEGAWIWKIPVQSERAVSFELNRSVKK